MDCSFYTENETCSLGLYGGKPSKGVCAVCIKNGRNNQQYATAQKLKGLGNSTDHEKQGVIAGCCDGGNEKQGSR